MAPFSLFNPAEMSSGGFIDDVDVTLGAVSVVTQEDTPFDAQDEDSCFLKVGFIVDDSDGEPKFEYYRIGSVEKFTPNSDHSKIVAAEGARINKSTKAGIFFAALVNAGFPTSDFPVDNSVGYLTGLRAHVNAIPMVIKGDGGGKFKKKDGQGDPKVVVITKLLEPATSSAKKGTAKKAAASKPNGAAGAPTTAPATPAAAAKAATSQAAEDAATEVILGLIAEKGIAVKRTLPTEIMRKVTDVALRSAAFPLANNNAWLGDDARPWAFDAGTGELTLRTE